MQNNPASRLPSGPLRRAQTGALRVGVILKTLFVLLSFAALGVLIILDQRGENLFEAAERFFPNQEPRSEPPPAAKPSMPDKAPLSVQPTAEKSKPSPTTYTRFEQHSLACQPIPAKPVETVTRKVYRWRDENGVLQFSDTPPETGKATVDRVISHEKKFAITIEDHGSGVPAFLQDKIRISAERIYQFLSAPLPTEHLRQADIRVHLIKDRQVFLAAYGNYKPGNLMPAGFYTSRTNEAFVLTTRPPAAVQETAIHETAHVIMAALYQATPVWLNEGVAEYFEDLPLSVIDNGYQVKSVWVNVLRKKGLMPLKQLFKLTHQDWVRLNPEVSYANAWAAVYYLMNSQAGKEAIYALLLAIQEAPCSPIPSVEIVDRHYPGGLSALQRDLSSWLSSVDLSRR